jgi:hypothetical protein
MNWLDAYLVSQVIAAICAAVTWLGYFLGSLDS